MINKIFNFFFKKNMEVSKGNYKIGSLTLEDLLKNYPNFEKMDSTLSTENYLNDNHKDLKRIKEFFLNEENLTKLEESESRALAVFIYSAIGDALGAHTEFLTYKKEGYNLIKGINFIRNLK